MLSGAAQTHHWQSWFHKIFQIHPSCFFLHQSVHHSLLILAHTSWLHPIYLAPPKNPHFLKHLKTDISLYGGCTPVTHQIYLKFWEYRSSTQGSFWSSFPSEIAGIAPHLFLGSTSAATTSPIPQPPPPMAFFLFPSTASHSSLESHTFHTLSDSLSSWLPSHVYYLIHLLHTFCLLHVSPLWELTVILSMQTVVLTASTYKHLDYPHPSCLANVWAN